MPGDIVSLEEIREARRRLAGTIRETPIERSYNLSRMLGRPIAFKPEFRQRTGSFKVRGAANFIAHLAPGTEVVAASAGNHAQGVALAATRAGLRATIFMPVTAPVPKVQATQDYGGSVHLEGQVFDEANEAGRAYAAERNAVFVPPFDDRRVIAGQGTIGLEVAEQAPDAEVVIVPVGGGGLIAGVAAALAQVETSGLRPHVVGVEPAGAASMTASLVAGRCVTLDRVSTMADGIAVKNCSELTLAHAQEFVDDVVTVAEDDISRAVVLLLERAKAVVEPAGAVGLAALLAGKVGGDGLAVPILSGGNVDPFLMMRLIDRGLSASGRFLVLRVVMHDRPGELARLSAQVSDMGLNILAVEHHRSGLLLPPDQVEVMLTLETRNPDHREAVVSALRRAGYEVDRKV